MVLDLSMCVAHKSYIFITSEWTGQDRTRHNEKDMEITILIIHTSFSLSNSFLLLDTLRVCARVCVYFLCVFVHLRTNPKQLSSFRSFACCLFLFCVLTLFRFLCLFHSHSHPVQLNSTGICASSAKRSV